VSWFGRLSHSRQPISAHVHLWKLPPGTDPSCIDGEILSQFWFEGWTVLSVDSLTDYLPIDMNHVKE
jgi:hypothetical protein